MSRPSGLARLRHMLDSAREAVLLVEGKTRRDLEHTRLLQLGLTRLVEIVGEAAARVPKDTREKLPAIPWADVVGMSNKIESALEEDQDEGQRAKRVCDGPEPGRLHPAESGYVRGHHCGGLFVTIPPEIDSGRIVGHLDEARVPLRSMAVRVDSFRVAR
jgi:uncharacterized protein with HEPN domain